MSLGYSKEEMMSMLEEHVGNINEQFEQQINKMKEGNSDKEITLSNLLTSSMLAMIDASTSIIEINNKKVHQDLVDKGIIENK